MKLKEKNIGFVFTGAFKSIECSIDEMEKIINMNNTVYPIMSLNAYKKTSNKTKGMIVKITNNEIINSSIKKDLFDIIIIEPCTSNTLSKLANNIIDTPVLYIVNYHITKNKPLVIGISCFNDISSSFENVGKLIKRKNIFFVPFRQTNPVTKPNYLMFEPKLTIDTIKASLNHKQLQPLLL